MLRSPRPTAASPGAVKSRLARLGIARRPPGWRPRGDEPALSVPLLADLYVTQGLSIAAIARRQSIFTDAVASALDAHGIARRSRRQARLPLDKEILRRLWLQEAADGSTTHAVSADGAGYTSPSLTWTQGGHPVSSSFSGSVSPGGTSVQTVTATASGTVSASADWNPSSTTNNDGPGDSPAHTKSGLLGLALTTYVSGPGGLLAIDTGGTASYPISNAHGDVVGMTDANALFKATPAIDEFGVGTPASGGLGFLGNKERFSTGGGLDMIRMGVRLYDPSVGRFLETDPVAGGSANAYDYVNGDPINGSDLGGTCGWATRSTSVLHRTRATPTVARSRKITHITRLTPAIRVTTE